MSLWMFPSRLISQADRSLLPKLLCLMLCLWVFPIRAEVTVMASIKPLELIAQDVVGDRAKVDRLLAPGASPHDYPLRVSEMRRIQVADLVLWVGEDLEAFLRRAVSQLPPERRMAASELDRIQWPATEQHENDGHHGDHHHHHHHGERDPHLWLDPRNGAVIALALAQRLAKTDPKNADFYQERAEAFAAELEDLDRTLTERLAPVREQGFAVYHEGYAHFVERYQLNQVASVTYTPERRPGARHLYQLREQLANAVCLFTEPYYDMGATASLATELDLRQGELDLLGASESVKRYPDLLSELADAMLACLSGEG